MLKKRYFHRSNGRFRVKKPMWRNGRRNGLKIRWAVKGPCRFESGHRQVSIAKCLALSRRLRRRVAIAIATKRRLDIRQDHMSATRERPLFVPVILGTARQGRQSENVALFVFEQTKKRVDVETELIDVRALPMRLDDAGEQIKDPAFSATIDRCDGIILI